MIAVQLLGKHPDRLKQLQSLATHVDAVSVSMAQALEKHYTDMLADMEREILNSEIDGDEKVKVAKLAAEELKNQQTKKIEQCTYLILKSRYKDYIYILHGPPTHHKIKCYRENGIIAQATRMNPILLIRKS